jgi:hypothetical protein
MLTKIVQHSKGDSREKMAIREEIAIIQKYLDGISPKLQKYQELTNKKLELQKKFRSL